MNDEVTITMATESDVSVILGFIQELAEYERMRELCVATEEKVSETLFGAHPAAEVLIARFGDEPVGFALFFHNYSTFLAQRGVFLEDLFVKPEGRGKGIGRALLSALARIAVDRGCARLEWVVLDWNELAIRFYINIGARPMDEWTTFRMTDEPLEQLASQSAGIG